MLDARVAWLIPVRNGAAWLGDAVRSALADSRPEDELIVVDDGSSDEPAAVLPADARVRLLRQPPLGIVAALEHGRRSTDAPLLARLDCDDLVIPGRLAAQRKLLAERPEVLAVGGRARTEGLPEGMRRYVEWINGLTDLRREILVESPLIHPATTIRASALAEVGGYRQGAFPEDYDLWLRLARIGELAAVPAEVVAWRDRPGRLTRTDPRYARKAFAGIKQAYVRDVALPPRAEDPVRVAVWGAGQEGTPWIRWLLAQGVQVVAALDYRAGGKRLGVPILPREAVSDLLVSRLFVAVGARGARAEIRAMIQERRADLVEGRHWWALA